MNKNFMIHTPIVAELSSYQLKCKSASRATEIQLTTLLTKTNTIDRQTARGLRILRTYQVELNNNNNYRATFV